MFTFVRFAELGYGNHRLVAVRLTLLARSVQPALVGQPKLKVLPDTDTWRLGALVFTSEVTEATVILPFDPSVLFQV